jgi:hypothetical protein
LVAILMLHTSTSVSGQIHRAFQTAVMQAMMD